MKSLNLILTLTVVSILFSVQSNAQSTSAANGNGNGNGSPELARPRPVGDLYGCTVIDMGNILGCYACGTNVSGIHVACPAPDNPNANIGSCQPCFTAVATGRHTPERKEIFKITARGGITIDAVDLVYFDGTSPEGYATHYLQFTKVE